MRKKQARERLELARREVLEVLASREVYITYAMARRLDEYDLPQLEVLQGRAHLVERMEELFDDID